MDPELAKTLISSSDAAGKLAASLDEFIKSATALKTSLMAASAELATVHKVVLSQPIEPVPVVAVKPEPVKPEPAKPAVVHDVPGTSSPQK